MHLFRWIHGRKYRQYAGIPGPPPRFPLGNAFDFLGRPPWRFRPPWLTCAAYAPRFGGLTLIWLGSRPLIVLNDARLVREVLETTHDAYYKADPVKALRPLTPEHSLFLSNDPQWHSLRKAHPLSLIDARQWLEGQCPIVWDLVRRRLQQWEIQSKQRPLDLSNELQRLTFDAFAQALCGRQLDDAVYQDFNHMGNVGARRILLPILPTPPLSPRFYSARRRWQRTFAQLIEDARQNHDVAKTDLLHRTLPRKDALPEGLSDRAYQVMLATMFYGGVYSVTSAVVSWIYCVVKKSKMEQDVRQELADRITPHQSPQLGLLESCQSLDHSLRESLRLLPPVPMFLRNVKKDRSVSLGGYTLPADTALLISTWSLHRNADHWRHPEQYLPDRWKDGAVAANLPGSDYFLPFGRGPRSCIGESFGMAFAKILAAAIIAGSQVDLSGHYRQSFYFGVMMPKGLKAKFGF